ncbi:hypothetical protein AMTRI_Chr05g63510 [Amborella trichopoda]
MRIIFKEPSLRASSAEAKHLQIESKTLKITRGFSSLLGSSTSPLFKPLGSTYKDIPKRSLNFYFFLLQLTLKKLAKIGFRGRERFCFFSGEIFRCGLCQKREMDAEDDDPIVGRE